MDFPSCLIKRMLGRYYLPENVEDTKRRLILLHEISGIAHNILLNFSDYAVKMRMSLCLASDNLWASKTEQVTPAKVDFPFEFLWPCIFGDAAEKGALLVS